MQKFYFNENNRLNTLLTQLNSVLSKFNARDIDCDMALLNVLDAGIQAYKELGITKRESQLLSLKAEFVTAQRGVNPLTFEKQLTRRHEMITTIIFKILQSTELQMRNDLTENENRLQQAAELVGQIITAAVQGGQLTGNDIKKINTQADAEKAWQQIGADENISLGQKRVLMLVSRFDALILFDDLLEPLKK
jgi:hypothetical protein